MNTQIAIWFLSLGLIGLLAMTVLFPVLGSLLYRFFGPSSSDAVVNPSHSDWVILIPVHNDLVHLQATLTSLPRSVRIVVGLDACTDKSEEYLAAKGIEFKKFSFKSKWLVLQELVKEVSEARVALVDVGAIWPSGIIEELNRYWALPDTIAVAPTYRPKDSGALEAWAWRLEACLKGIENLAGGPVAIHGASVCYSRPALQAAFDGLVLSSQWKNDDVVIPLCLRMLFPRGRIRYVKSLAIQDLGIQRGGFPLRRRLRMLIGNIEVARWAFSGFGSRFSIAHVLFLRRMARVLWVYDLLFFALALLAWLSQSSSRILGGQFVLGLFVLVLFFKWNRMSSIAAAALASFLAPVFMISRSMRNKIVW